MIGRRALMLGALAAGCTAPAAQGYRDASQPIGATTRFTAQRFAGDWDVVAAFGSPPSGRMRFDPASGVLSDLSQTPARSFEVNSKGGLIVMWVDDGFRTAALGTFDGSVGFILDRATPGAPDRMTAAREVLAFYGWDVARLESAV